MRSNTVLVTGGAGFIGRALSERLVKEGAKVWVLDDYSRGRLSAVHNSEVAYLNGDVRDPQAVDAAVSGADEVIHLAAVNGTNSFYARPCAVLDVGVRGILNVIDACVRYRVKRLTIASSSEAYQTPPSIPTPEDVPLVVPSPHNPRYSYGASKIISEVLALNYGLTEFERVLIFRPHNVYGPGMRGGHVIPDFINNMESERNTRPYKLALRGLGTEVRSFCYITDLIDGIMVMREKGAHRGVYNIGTPVPYTIKHVAQKVAEAVAFKLHGTPPEDVQLEIRYSPGPQGGAPYRCPDISKLQELGYSPKVDLEEGLAKTVDWMLSNPTEQ